MSIPPRVRGMRDIKTSSNLIAQSSKGAKAQIVNQIARLEHERMRLERELQMWQSKQVEAETRLANIQDQIQAYKNMADGDTMGDTASEVSMRPLHLTKAAEVNTRPNSATLNQGVIIEY